MEKGKMGRNAHDVIFYHNDNFLLIDTVINADRSNLKLKYTLRIFFRVNKGDLIMQLLCNYLRRVQNMRLQVPTASSVKMTAVWDIAPCSLVEVDRRFGSAYCLHHKGFEWFIEDDGGSTHFRNVGLLQ
jgi:hypothetical protein